MEINKLSSKEESLKRELQLMIDIVKAHYKSNGEKISQEDMAMKMGKGKKFLSHLLNGHQTINENHLILFQGHFRDYLPTEQENLKSDLAVLQSSVNVLMREVAKLKNSVYSDKEATAYLQELAEEISLDEVGRQMQEER